MRYEQWTCPPDRLAEAPATLRADWVLASGPVETMADPAAFAAVRAHYPGAVITGASSGGDVVGREVRDGDLAVTAIAFEHTEVVLASAEGVHADGSYGAGAGLAAALEAARPGEAPAHVFLLADLGAFCGDALALGLSDGVPGGAVVTGGHAALPPGAPRSVVWADGVLGWPAAAAVALYGERLGVGHGAVGGWTPFGPDRLVTRAEHNVVYSLDDQPALDLYKRYLGPLAEHLPHSALFFPLAIHDGTGDRSAIVRSALTIDEDSGSVGFAGGVREGMYARLMKMNAESVIDGAAQAAREAAAMLGGPAALALAVSCYGRRQVLGQRAEEELEAVADALGGAALAGFYAYGEFAPTAGEPGCTLHNQTMTVTALAER